jgi:hypothetical protein
MSCDGAVRRVLVSALMSRGLYDPPNIFLEGELAGGIKLICYFEVSKCMELSSYIGR